MTQDERIQERVEELTQEVKVTLQAICNLAPANAPDPLVDAQTLTRAVQTGILDAPQLQNNPYGCGQTNTRIDKRGACISIDPKTRKPIKEKDRIDTLNLTSKPISTHRRT
jgi:hypothetical protein